MVNDEAEDKQYRAIMAIEEPERSGLLKVGQRLIDLEFDLAKLRERAKKLEALCLEIGQYALKKGESWRVGEGTEVMDAYDAVEIP